MQHYTIKVFGSQWGDPPYLVDYLSKRFGIPYERIEINPPNDVLTITIPLDSQAEIFVSAVIPAVLHKQQTYQLHLNGADGIVYVLNASRGLEFYNREDFDIFAPLYRSLIPPIPVVTLLNDFWAGGCEPGLFAPAEVQPYVIDQSPLFETVLADPTQASGMDAMRCLIALIKTSRKADNQC